MTAVHALLGSVAAEVQPAGPGDAVDGVPAGLVARPRSTAEVAELLGAAAAAGLTVVPRGRGTKLSWGRPPERADLVVDLSRMHAVLDHAAGDLIVDVQAGARLADVQAHVGAASQRLSLDETVPGASIGGTLAAGTSGPRRLIAGTARDLLIGVTLVRADGVVAKAGGRVVKNVAGYDLGKLVIGSYGTLAVITEAVFRLHPLPAATAVVTAPFAGPGDAGRLVHAVLQAQVVPSAVELDWPAAGPGRVAVLLEGSAAGVAARAAATAGLLGARAEQERGLPAWWGRCPLSGASDRSPVPDVSASADTSGAAPPGTPPANGAAPRATLLKMTFLISGLAGVLTASRQEADAGVPLSLRGSAGSGVLHGAIPGDTEVSAVARVVDRLRAHCAAAGGALVVTDAAPAVQAAVDSWGPVPGLELMRRVKERFDPERRLAPGRFVGGI